MWFNFLVVKLDLTGERWCHNCRKREREHCVKPRWCGSKLRSAFYYRSSRVYRSWMVYLGCKLMLEINWKTNAHLVHSFSKITLAINWINWHIWYFYDARWQYGNHLKYLHSENAMHNLKKSNIQKIAAYCQGLSQQDEQKL